MNKKSLIILFGILSMHLKTLELKEMSVFSSTDENFYATINLSTEDQISPSQISLENSKKSLVGNDNLIDVSLLKKEIKKIDGRISIVLSSENIMSNNRYDFRIEVNHNGRAINSRYFGFIPEAQERAKRIVKQPVNDLSSCLNLEDPQARLDCYDRSLNRPSQDKKITNQIVKKEKEIELDEEDLFGKKGSDLEEVIAKTQKIQIPNQLTTTITLVKSYAPDKYILTLSNGQKWRVLDATRKGFFKVDQSVSITKGILGSYNLNLFNQNRKLKVKREK